jgi:hypothetical protein
MIGYQYPISRADIINLDLLEMAALALADEPRDNLENAISVLGNLLFQSALKLNLDEDVANLCEFSKRVGMEVLPQESRIEMYGDNCWVVGPRDAKILKFKQGNNNASDSIIVSVATRNAAMVLYFLIPLYSAPTFKVGSEIFVKYIEDNKLWSFLETERVRNSRVGVPFNMADYLKRNLSS